MGPAKYLLAQVSIAIVSIGTPKNLSATLKKTPLHVMNSSIGSSSIYTLDWRISAIKVNWKDIYHGSVNKAQMHSYYILSSSMINTMIIFGF